jgi:iron complex outermembrane recepter protein
LPYHRKSPLAPPLLAAAASWLALIGPSAAQTDEIVVTAERRPQPLSSQGGAIAALDAEDLRRIGMQHTAEVLNRLPAMNYHRGSGVENLPAIRSPVLNGGQGAGSFLVLEDGVPVRAPPFANINQVYETSLEFAERIEVIRGPGTSVHGANAVHGVLNVITPHAGSSALVVEGEAGSFGRARALATRRGPSWLFGFAASHEDGWRDQAGLDLQKALLGWDGQVGGWSVRARTSASNLEQETAGFVIGPNAYADRTLARANLNPEAFRDSRVFRASLAATRRFGEMEMTLTPFARQIDTDLLLHFFPSKALEETTQSGGGVQSTIDWPFSPAWRLLTGLDLDVSSMRLRETQSIPTVGTFPQGVHYDYRVDAVTSAAYAQLNWRPAEAWSLTLGGRAEHIDYAYDNRAPDGAFGRFLRAPDRNDAFSATTARVNAVRQLRGGGAVYVNFTTGARPPQATDLYSLQVTQTPGEQGVEEIASRELGVRLPVGAGRLALIAYDMRKRNGAFRNANGFTVENTRTNHRGIEAEFEAPLTAHLSVSGWVSYSAHTYDFDSPADGIVSGRRIESAPDWTGAVQLLWRPGANTEFELGWNHVGPYLTEASGAHSYPGHDLLSLRAFWRLNAGTEMFASVRNLTNIGYAERADFAFGNERYFPGEERALSVGVRLKR